MANNPNWYWKVGDKKLEFIYATIGYSFKLIAEKSFKARDEIFTNYKYVYS